MDRKPPLRFALIGCGFWAQYQIAAWRELPDAELTAVCDRDGAKAAATARRFGIPRYTDDVDALFDASLDFVDIVTNVETHAELAMQAARRGLPAIVQKPMAPDIPTARSMIAAAEGAGGPLLVHENFRWQAPMRRVKTLLDEGAISRVFKARLSFCSAFPVYDNQPALAELEQFILTDIGTHVLDVARFLLGEAVNLTCRTQRVNPAIRGEDVANVLMEMASGAHCFVEMSYASLLEREAFPQTLALVEGTEGSIRLGLDGEIAVTTRAGTRRETVAPASYPWADPAYALVQASAVDCNRNLLAGLRDEAPAETTAADNLQTLQLFLACYKSARTGVVIDLSS